MSEQIPTILWDSVVLINWIKGKTANPAKIAAIKKVLWHEERDHCQLIFSTLVYPEVLESAGMPVGSEKALDSFLQSRTVIGVDITVAKKAQEIRNNSIQNKTKLRTPDAIMVATAIIADANMIHTFDTDDLVKLHKSPVVEHLAITECELPRPPVELTPIQV